MRLPVGTKVQIYKMIGTVGSPSIVNVHHARDTPKAHSKGCADSGAAASTETDIETETETETEAPRIIRMIGCSNFGVRTRNYCWVATRQNLVAIPDSYRKVSSIHRRTYRYYTSPRSSRSGSKSSNIHSNFCLPVLSMPPLSPSGPPPLPTMMTTRSPLQNSPITWRHMPHGVIGVAMLLPSFDNQLLRATRGRLTM